MALLSRLADWFVLCPSRFPIPAPHKTCRLIDCPGGQIEAWIQRTHPDSVRHPDLFVLKFVGNASRAERATHHPLDMWDRTVGEVWAVNPPGYGCSPGRANLRSLSDMAIAAYEAMSRVAAGRPIVITGNSLGTAMALHVAATEDVAGLILRNPPPLRELIIGRYSWWNLGLARLIAAQIPHALNSVDNARRCRAACVFMISGQDTLVPPAYQQLIISAYGGPERVLRLNEADHATPPTPAQVIQYRELLAWLGQNPSLKEHVDWS